MKTKGNVDSVVSKIGRQYLRLQMTADIGPIRLRNLVAHFGSLDAVLSASMAELERVERVGPHVAESIFKSRHDEDVDREIEHATACGVRIVCMEDGDYPQPLLNIPDPPICLYIRGRLEPADCVAVAIVGTRRCSHYGREQAVRFGELLGRAGFTVVSGLARGVDGHAHRGALRAEGRTIAVLGNGLTSVYPSEHETLADDIARSGAVVSELPLDAAPEAKNFPGRNRILAGLSLGVVVIEAGKQSGALITARLASEYNREVFAVPGRVDQPQYTHGVHSLVRDGQAQLVTCLEDILDELGDVGEVMRRDAAGAPRDESAGAISPCSVPGNLSPDERAVFNAVAEGADDAERISVTTEMAMAPVTAALTSLQLKGLLRRMPGNRFHCRIQQNDR